MNSMMVAQIGFIVLTVVMYVLLLVELKKGIAATAWDDARKKSTFSKIVITLLTWTIFISGASISGVLSDFTKFPPRVVIVLVAPMIGLLTVLFSNSTREVLMNIPAKSLVGLQFFRVFVEILLWILFLQNLLPVQMTFEGRNFDVLSGLTAPFAAYFLANNRIGLVVWNIFSLALLANILAVAVLSMPTPFRYFMNEPANTIVTTFPFIWLPGLLVPLAYGLSFLSLRQVAIKNSLKTPS